jgi:C4-dicarboxylate-specific signal transduction histidine kinase
MEAIGEDGSVRVELSANGRRPCLAVRDSGPGIPSDVETHLFTPFFSTKSEGQGIGLTLIREILTQHDLDFDLRNVDPVGAEFRIFF